MPLSQANYAVLAFFFDSPRGRTLPSVTHMRPYVSRSTRACVLLVAALCLLTAQPGWCMPGHRSRAVHKVIEALEMEWRNAELNNNVGVMSRLLADDYLGISANGTVETKPQEIAQRRAGTVRIQSLNLSDIKVRVYGDTAVVTSTAELVGVNGQSNISGNYRYTRVYNKRFGQWKIVSFEASRIHDVDARAKH